MLWSREYMYFMKSGVKIVIFDPYVKLGGRHLIHPSSHSTQKKDCYKQ